MKKRLMQSIAVALAAVMTMGMCACGGSGSSSGSTADAGSASGESGDLQKVTVILDYTPNTNHTGMYVALDKGYYEQEGLDVEIIEPTDGATATLVAQGKGTFGISYQEDVTIALTSEDPLPIKTIAAIIQHNTSGFVSLADSGIESPADFEGKYYAGWSGAGETPVLTAIMSEAGADINKLHIIEADGTGFEELGNGCDIEWFFEGWDCILAADNGVELNYMPCRDLDERLDYYTPVIITSDDVIEQDPEMVKAFLSATAKGYEDAIADPDGAAEILYKYVPDYDLDFLKESQEYLADKYMEDTDTWGMMKDEVWDNYTGFLKEYGVIDEAIPASDCYTNEFLQ